MATEKRLIDANTLIKQFDDCNFKGFVLKRLIEMQPTVDAVEVVHGRWKKVEVDLGRGINTHKFACSKCGFLKNTLIGNYCLNCGAKMDGDGNG